jgi:T5SS/PEP-CTERM-associated repeat protein
MSKSIMLVLLVLSAPLLAVDYEWNNNSGDNDFVNLNNWYEIGTTNLPAGPFTAADNLLVELAGTDKAVLNSASAGRWLHAGWNDNTSGEIEIAAGADLNLSNSVYLAYGSNTIGTINMTGGLLSANSSYTTIALSGQGYLNVSGGTYSSDRMSVGNGAGGRGEANVSGTGQMTFANDIYVGQNGEGYISVSDQASFSANDMTAGRYATGASQINVSGTGQLTLTGYSTFGSDAGKGTLNVSGGSFIANRMNAGTTHVDSLGEVNVSGTGQVNLATYATFGNIGQGVLNVSGGSFIADRMTLGQNGGSGTVVVSGTGSFELADYLQGSTGDFLFRLEGSGASVTINDNIISTAGFNSYAFEFALDGANGVGSGIFAQNAIDLAEGVEIDLSFIGAAIDGTYTIMSSAGTITDLSTSGLLSDASVAAGWTYDIVSGESLTELQVTIPEPATVLLLVGGGVMALRRRKTE